MGDVACVPGWVHAAGAACKQRSIDHVFCGASTAQAKLASGPAPSSTRSHDAKPTMTAAVQLLLVHDDADFSQRLCQYLARFGLQARAAANLAAMRASLAAQRIDLLVLGLHLTDDAGPGAGTGNGLGQVCDELGRSGERLPVIALSPHAHWMDRVIGLEMGADDFVAQPVEPRELVARIRAVLRRAGRGPRAPAPVASAAPEPSGSPAQVLRFGAWVLDCSERCLGRTGVSAASPQASPPAFPQALPAAEFKLLATLLRNAGRVCSRDHLALVARGRGAGTAGRGIDLLVSRLRQRLGDDALAPRWIKTVRGVGYLFDLAADAQAGVATGAPAHPRRQPALTWPNRLSSR